MLEAETTPSEISQLSDIFSVTVPNSITAYLDSEKPTAPPGFHWLGDKPISIYEIKRKTVLGAFRPVPYVDTSVLRFPDINKAVFGSITCRLSEVLGQYLICVKSLSVERGDKNFLIISACLSFKK